MGLEEQEGVGLNGGSARRRLLSSRHLVTLFSCSSFGSRSIRGGAPLCYVPLKGVGIQVCVCVHTYA